MAFLGSIDNNQIFVNYRAGSRTPILRVGLSPQVNVPKLFPVEIEGQSTPFPKIHIHTLTIADRSMARKTMILQKLLVTICTTLGLNCFIP